MAQVLGDHYDKIVTLFKGKTPYGEDAKYDDMYIDLKNEILKLTAMSSKETTIDWKAIKAWSIEILETKSKDLTVSGYMVLGLYIVDGYAGVRDGFDVMRKLVTDDWDGLFPPKKRMRGRVSVFQWLVERLSPLIADREPKPEEAEHLEPILEAVKAIQEKVQEACAHQAPGFGELLEAITTRVNEAKEAAAPPPEPPAEEAPAAAPAEGAPQQPAPEAAPAAPPVEAAPSAPTPAPAAAPEAAAVPRDPTQTMRVVVPPAPTTDGSGSQLRDQLLAFVSPLRQAEPLHPTPYRLLRSLKWDSLAGPPAADPGTGKTRIPAPRSQQRMALEGLFQASNWQVLLNASEGAFQESSGTFWLDLQFFTGKALEGLDPAGTQGRAARVVREEVMGLVDRYRALAGYSYADGSPMASDKTREWLAMLAEESGSSISLAPPPAAGASGDEGSVLEQAEMEKAQDLFGKKKPSAALAVLQDGVDRAPTLRSRFHTRLAASRVCLQSNQPAWSKTLLEDLLSQAEAFSFETWETAATVELHQLLAVSYGRLAKDRKTEDRPAMKALFEEHLAKLFKLDMRAAAAASESI